jgi:hypothetical protein
MERCTYDNDNEPMHMLPIGLAALAILDRLRTTMQLRDLERAEDQNEQREGQSEACRSDEKECSEHCADIEKRSAASG